MKALSFGLPALLLLVAAPAADAATVTVHVKHRHGVTFGHVRFIAGSGERNALTVTRTTRGVVYRDSANAVRARGDCVQLTAHSARCPSTEDIPVARLRDGDDRANVADVVSVDGGAGDDVLRGAREGDQLAGGTGDDLLRGGRGGDALIGGPGRDSVFGGSGDDELVDGETDAQAARDVYRGGNSRDSSGPDRGDVIDYGMRRRALRIDLGRHRSNTGDRILGLESVVGGRGDDRLSGDGDDNELDGGRGDDVLRGRGAQDILLSGPGDDRAAGGDAHDVVWGQGGDDRLDGDAGDDLMEARDGGNAERVECGRGSDDTAVNDRADTLTASCEISSYQTFSRGFRVRVQPAAVAGGTATFRVACFRDGFGKCSGTIRLAGLDGTPFGSGAFAGLDDPETFANVPVALTPAGAAALHAGATVQVAFGKKGGYRAFMRGG